jgi:hypothetical protein
MNCQFLLPFPLPQKKRAREKKPYGVRPWFEEFCRHSMNFLNNASFRPSLDTSSAGGGAVLPRVAAMGFAATAGRRASQDCASGVRAKPGNVAARLTSRHFGWRSEA